MMPTNRCTALLALGCVLLLPHAAGAGSTGSSSLFMPAGSGAPPSSGDYISASAGMDTPYHYFIEAPAGLARLRIQIFDADIGAGGNAEAALQHDRARSGFNTTATYSLFDPTGAARPVAFGSGTATLPAAADNAWLTIFDSTTTLTAGHWELRVNQSGAATTGWDLNALGIRADDGDATSAGTEL